MNVMIKQIWGSLNSGWKITSFDWTPSLHSKTVMDLSFSTLRLLTLRMGSGTKQKKGLWHSLTRLSLKPWLQIKLDWCTRQHARANKIHTNWDFQLRNHLMRKPRENRVFSRSSAFAFSVIITESLEPNLIALPRLTTVLFALRVIAWLPLDDEDDHEHNTLYLRWTSSMRVVELLF